MDIFGATGIVYIIMCTMFNKDLFDSMKLLIVFKEHFYGLLFDTHSFGVKPNIMYEIKKYWKTIID